MVVKTFEKNTMLDRNRLLLAHLLAALILTFVLRMSLPAVRYVYYPLFVVAVVYHLVRKPEATRLRHLFRRQVIYLLLLAVLTAAAFYHSAFLRPYTEVVNGIQLAVIFVILFVHIQDEGQWDGFKKAFLYQLFVFALIIAAAGLGRLLLTILSGDFVPDTGESLVSTASDYNFYALTLLYGLLIGVYKLLYEKKGGRGRLVLYNLSMALLSLALVLTPSRRGILLFVLLVAVVLILRLMAIWRGGGLLSPRMRRLDPLLLTFLVAVILLRVFFFHTPHRVKEHVLLTTGLYRIELRSRTTNAYRLYAGMLGSKPGFREAYNILWKNGGKSDGSPPKDGASYPQDQASFPHDGTSSPHDREAKGDTPMLIRQAFRKGMGDFKPTGQGGVRIIPGQNTGGTGFLVIRAGSERDGVDTHFFVDTGDTIRVSAWVRVIRWSPNLAVSFPGPDNEKLQYLRPDKGWEGDGQWHRLTTTTGYDVFGALPLRIGGGGPGQQNSLSCWRDLQVSRITGAEKQHIHDSIKKGDVVVHASMAGMEIDRRVPPLKNHAGSRQEGRKSGATTTVAKGLFGSSALKQWLLEESDERVMDEWQCNQQVIHDQPYDTTGPYPDTRIGRWHLAKDIFTGYDPAARLLGKGFAWLPLYGEVFYGNTGRYDYPHNPLISALLYSGILGAMLYLGYLGTALLFYIRHARREGVFMVFFLVTAVFVSVSGNSHFSVPAFAFFAQLPFFFSLISHRRKVRDT